MVEKRSQLAEAVLRWFESQGPQGIAATDDELRVTLWNEWLEEATGIPASTALGQLLFEVVPSLVERGFDQYYVAALAGEVKVLSHAFHRYVVPTAPDRVRAEQMPQSGRIVPLTDDGGVIGTMTMIDDVSERVASDRELRGRIATAEAASRLKDEFLATLSHEIRTPLNAVIGWTRILRSKPITDMSTIKRAIEVIDRNASAQLTLVSDMLDVARISSGKVRLEIADVDLAAVVLAAIDVIRPAADAKGVRLVTDLAPHLPVVNGDHDRLLQVAWNLLSNAVKFTDPGGQVTVRLAATGGAVVLSVRDNGHGIDRSFLPHVFERFRQADPSSSRRYGGLGLGLALVKDLVELHGGTVSVSSKGVGEGSEFQVRLPGREAVAATARAGARLPLPPGSGALSGVRVLLVDDDADSVELFGRTVEDANGEVAWVPSVADALARLEGHPERCPHVIVSDIGMPGTDGYSFLKLLRKLPPDCGGALPVIALTAYATPEDRVRALRSGFDDHIGKPFDPDDLVSAIVSAMRV
jgi:PAS domain S-box-containing protein